MAWVEARPPGRDRVATDQPFTERLVADTPSLETSRVSRMTPSKAVDARLLTDRRFRALIEFATDAIAILDPSGTFRYANPASRYILGYPPDELTGSDIRGHVHEDDRDAVVAALAAVSAGSRGAQVDLAFRSQTRAGQWRLHDATLRNLLDHPDVAGIVLTAREMGGADDALEQLNQRQRIEGIVRLAGGVAHDYNNLLTVVTANAEMLLETSGLDEESRDVIGEIAAAAGRAADLTRQLLAFSRQQVFRLEPLAPDAMLRELEPAIREELGPAIALAIDVEQQPGMVLADLGQLQLVILHLVRNARDAMPNGGHLRIECDRVVLSAEQVARLVPMVPGAYVRIRVVDTGTGMDAATRARAFEPFFTTKERGKGTGLGLAMVHGIVKQSGGFIWIDSVPGAGTALTVYLPAVSPESLSRHTQHPRTTSSSAPRETILVAEDEELVRRMTRRTLERVGYRVLVASDAEQALQLAREGSPQIDLLLTDIVMPGMNGRDLARTLRAERPALHVLLMSGYAHVRAAFGRGADDTPFLQKPFTVEQLLARVREVLATSSPSQ